MGGSGGERVAFRGAIAHCLSDPGEGGEGFEYLEDGVLIVADGRIERLGEATALLPALGDVAVHDRRGTLIVPGFVDVHLHYPQTDMIASHGAQLLEWLESYVFPVECRFSDTAYATDTAEFFLAELLRNGTTSALVLGTVHARSVDVLFEAAARRGLRLIAGKVLMDRNCPEALRDTPESAYRESKALIERWHGQDRLRYAITPRFAPTSSEAQLERAGRLAAEHPDVYVHTHLAENANEVGWVAELFPDSRSYVDVYERFGLLRERSVFAHCIHLDDTDRRRMGASGATMAFCPSANLFLGSGLFDLAAAEMHGARVGLGTDVGAGTTFSLLRLLGEAYKVVQMTGQSLSPERALYLATLGGARALHIDDAVGSFAPGKEADFVVLDPEATPLLARRCRAATTPSERLFALMTLGDDRAVAETFVQGVSAHRREASP